MSKRTKAAALAVTAAIAAGVALALVRDGSDSPPEGIDLATVPALDRSRHAVPLDRIVFDTFNGSYVPLSDASDGLVRSLRDWIPPIYRPRYGEPDALAWLSDGDLVVGFVGAGGRAYAYPLKVLNLRELVNDEIDGEPVLVSYCPLCGSGVVFSRTIAGRTLLFGNTSALYESDLVMFDHQTGSYWFQVAGEAIAGTLTGTSLTVLPSTTAPWGEWKRLHPDTRLLVGDAEERFGARYAWNPFGNYEERVDAGHFPFPVSDERLDRRLRLSEVVIAVEAGEAEKAYPVRLLGDSPVNDVVGGEPVLVVSGATGQFATAFGREARERTLTFDLDRSGGLRDRETGSTWDRAGRAVAGPLRGERLEALPARRAFWFSIALARPGIALYEP